MSVFTITVLQNEVSCARHSLVIFYNLLTDLLLVQKNKKSKTDISYRDVNKGNVKSDIWQITVSSVK